MVPVGPGGQAGHDRIQRVRRALGLKPGERGAQRLVPKRGDGGALLRGLDGPIGVIHLPGRLRKGSMKRLLLRAAVRAVVWASDAIEAREPRGLGVQQVD